VPTPGDGHQTISKRLKRFKKRIVMYLCADPWTIVVSVAVYEAHLDLRVEEILQGLHSLHPHGVTTKI